MPIAGIKNLDVRVIAGSTKDHRPNGRFRPLALLLSGMLLLASISLRAQSIANYAPVTRTTGIIYSSDSATGNAFPAWRNNTAGNSNQDDNRSYPVNIGFDFWYDGVRYTQFSASTNGFMDLSSATFDGGPASRPYGPYDADLSTNSQSGGTVLGIAPLYYDLTTQGEVDPLGNSIKYLTTGTAPNRVLTVEWLNMSEWPNHSSNTNFQVKLFESTGVIEFLYGSMSPGSGFTWSYTLGINGPSLSNTPAASELLIQQTQNTTTFNNTVQNSLATLPASYSMLTFTPPTPADPTNLTFTSVQLTSMNLNWTDNANNEVGYVIYRSDDGGATYNFIHQLAANSTSSTETGLLAGTTYYWKVYAVTEGRLSNALAGSQTTSPAPNVISAQTGPWNTGSTWIGGIVPASTANVIIADNTTVTLDGSNTANSVTVGQGGSGATLIIGNSATARALTVNGSITVNSGASLAVNSAFSQTAHQINVSGDILNSGTFNMETGPASRCVVVFNRNGAQNIEGGGTTRFGKITLNMGSSSSNILDVSATNFVDTVANFLTLSNGTFRLSTGATITPFQGNVAIPMSAGLWLYSNSPAVTIQDSLIVAGSLRVSSGTLTIGNAADARLMSDGGTFTIEGGTLNIAGRFAPYNGFTTTSFTMSGGVLNVPTIGSTSTTDAPFSMTVAGSYFEMTGGTIIIKHSGGSHLGFLNTGGSTYSVTGGTLQIGDASTSSSDTIAVKTISPVYNLLAAGTTPTVTARLDTSLTVKNNITINLGNSLNANTFNISVAGLWSDAGTFAPSTAAAIFNGTSAQTISKTSSAETFNKLTINNSASVSLAASTNATVADSFQILQGTFAVASNTLTLNGGVASSGTLTSNAAGTVSYNKSSAGQSVIAANYGNLIFSNFTKTLPSSGTVGIASAFTPGTAAGHTITGSTVDFNGSGAQTIPWFLFNNLNVSTSGTKTLSVSTADTVLGNFTINSGAIFADGGFSLRVAKNVTNNNAHTGSGNITLIAGSAAHSLSGTGTYTNLILNDANGATLSNNLTVNGVLTFTNGIITTSAVDTVIISAGASVSRTSGHVNGNLEKNFSTGSNVLRLFEIGDAATFAPDTITFASVTAAGNLTCSVTAGDNPTIASSGVDPNHSVNRYWTISNNGIAFTTYKATFDFTAGDIDAGSTTGTFIVGKLDAAWSLTGVGTRTGTSTQATGMNSIYASGSSFVIGNVATTATNSYRSVATGNWNATATWQRYNGTSWVAAAAVPDSTVQSIELQSPYTVTMTASTNADQLQIDAGATLVINSGQTFTLHDGAGTDLTTLGTLTNSGTITQGTATITVASGGVYTHNTNSTANIKATWDPNSTCQFTGVTNGTPANFAQTFGHFTWNCASQTATISIAGVLTTIAGNFTMTSTGTGELDLAATQSQTTTIGGNYSQTGGTFGLSTGNGAPTVSIAGNFSMSGGTLRMKGTAAGGNFSGVSTMNVGGNFSFTSGTISRKSTNTGGKGLIVFNGTGIQSYTSGGTIATTDSIGFTVNSGATLYVGTSSIIGGGTFTLSSGAVLGIGSTNGITASGATGNVQTTGRAYNTGASYVYNGSSLQSTGNGLPATVNKLTINNGAGVNLTNATQTDSLYLTSGTFNVNAAVTLTINNLVVVGAGSLTSAATGTVNYSKPSNGQSLIIGSYGNLTFSNFSKIFPSSGTLSIAGTFTQGTGTGHVVAGSTVAFNGTSSQVIPAFAFNNLTTSGSWKGLGGAVSVAGNLTITSGVLSDSSFILTVNGNIANSAVHKSGSGEIYLSGGASAHVVSGGGTFANVELNDGYGITTSGNLNVGGTLTLTRGIITTAADSVVIVSGGAVSRAVTGLPRHVYGNLKMYVATGSPVTLTMHVGDASTYAPIGLTFASVSAAGYIVASTVGSEHPALKISGIDQTSDANRYWTIADLGTTFTTYALTLNFASSDLDPTANTSYFFIRRYSSPLWYGTNTSARTSSSTQSVGLGPTDFGDFAVGQVQGYFRWTGIGGDTKWSTAANWSLNSVPTSMNDVVLDTTAIINSVTATDSCRSLTISNSGIQLSVTTGTLTVAGNLSMSAGSLFTQTAFPSITGTISLTGGKVGFNGTGAQTIPAYSYYDLSTSGAHTTNNLTLAPGTISVADSFTNSATFTTGSWVNTGNTFIYNGSAAQLVGAIMYNNLSIINARGSNNITFSASDTVHIAGTLTASATFSSNYGYVLTGTIFDYNGAGSQTVPCMAYNSLRISGARSTNTLTLSSTDTIHVAGTFSPAATFSGTGGYQSAGTVFEYNGAAAQNIAAFTYNNLVLTNGGASAKTFTGTDSVKGNLVINNGATGAGGTGTVVLFGNWTNNGSFTPSNSVVEFGGVPSAAISGATAFSTLNVNKHDSATAVTLNNNINVGTLNMLYGTMQTGANSVTITTARTGNGLVLGTVTRTQAFALSTAYAFEGPNTLITFTAGSVPSSVTVTVSQTAPSNTIMMPVNRSVTISNTGGSFTATVRLHYENIETNSLDETLLKLWEYTGGAWVNMGGTSHDSVNNYVETTGITSFSPSWAIGASASSKTFVDLSGGGPKVGDTLAYTVTVFNPYKITKSSVTVSDPLPANFILVPGSISNSGSVSGQVLTGKNLEGGTITWPAFSLAGDGSLTRTFRVCSDSTIGSSQTITNTAQINYGGSASEYVSVPVTIANLPNLAIANSVNNPNPIPGNVLTYTISIKNNGTANATNITLNTAVPANTTFNANAYGAGMGVQVNGVAMTNAADADAVTVSGTSITVTIASIAAGATTQIVYQTTVN